MYYLVFFIMLNLYPSKWCFSFLIKEMCPKTQMPYQRNDLCYAYAWKLHTRRIQHVMLKMHHAYRIVLQLQKTTLFIVDSLYIHVS